MAINTCIFDAYGTLFDVAAAARETAQKPEFAQLAPLWPTLSEHWRQKQLQYTWLRNIAHAHVDFWQITQDALDWALEKLELSQPELRKELLTLYWQLQPYGEVKAMLSQLQAADFQCGILSNGSYQMLDAAVNSAQLAPLLQANLSIDDVGIFKPDPRVYQMVLARFSCEKEQVLFVSSNGWDIAGAGAFGFQTLWVNRAQEPVDRLPNPPDHQVQDLSALPKLLENL